MRRPERVFDLSKAHTENSRFRHERHDNLSNIELITIEDGCTKVSAAAMSEYKLARQQLQMAPMLVMRPPSSGDKGGVALADPKENTWVQ